MKKTTIMAMLLAAGTVTTQAADYKYLTIEKKDGTAVSMTAQGLSITYADGSMKAVNGAESASFTLSDLKRMYFSNTKADGDATAIEATAADWNDAETEIYDLSGRRLPQGTKPARGLYIFKKGNITTKKFVR